MVPWVARFTQPPVTGKVNLTATLLPLVEAPWAPGRTASGTMPWLMLEAVNRAGVDSANGCYGLRVLDSCLRRLHPGGRRLGAFTGGDSPALDLGLR